jgi:hypothetical protein
LFPLAAAGSPGWYRFFLGQRSGSSPGRPFAAQYRGIGAGAWQRAKSAMAAASGPDVQSGLYWFSHRRGGCGQAGTGGCPAG